MLICPFQLIPSFHSFIFLVAPTMFQKSRTMKVSGSGMPQLLFATHLISSHLNSSWCFVDLVSRVWSHEIVIIRKTRREGAGRPWSYRPRAWDLLNNRSTQHHHDCEGYGVRWVLLGSHSDSCQQLYSGVWWVVTNHWRYSAIFLVRLGNSGLKVSKIILGCMTYGSSEWQGWVLDEKAGIEHVKAAYVIILSLESYMVIGM